MMDVLLWWFGAGVVSCVGVAGAAVLIASTQWILVLYCNWRLRRIGVTMQNLRHVLSWVENGRPQWRYHDGVFALEPPKPGYHRRSGYEAVLEKELRRSRRRERLWVRLWSLALLTLIGYLTWSCWA